jgi:hypothetical protein
MVCIKDACPVLSSPVQSSPIRSEPAEHVIYKRYQHRNVHLMTHISALQKFPKIQPTSETPNNKTVTIADISRKYREGIVT